MADSKSNTRFCLGKISMTHGVLNQVPAIVAWISLMRHADCDWGDICKTDWKRNDDALESGSRLLSAYKVRKDLRLWIATEWDRSATTIFLPNEY